MYSLDEEPSDSAEWSTSSTNRPNHWCANNHKKERNWLVLECQKLVLEMNFRLTFLSGDVHLAAVGCLFTHKKTKKLEPEQDHRYMLNIVTSAIVVSLNNDSES
jgi:hypothetical protein